MEQLSISRFPCYNAGMYEYQHYAESAEYVKSMLSDFRPSFLLILGSGLGVMGERVENPVHIPYGDIPHFKTSTAPGHAGRFVCGDLGGKPVMVMQGRFHVYEGYSAEEAAYPVRVARLLGAESMIVTNAAGGVNLNYKVGDLVALTDFIKFAFPNPLLGKNVPEFGPRFADMSAVFDKGYLKLIKECAAQQGITLREGVYFYATGPQYETPAEIRAFRTLGADVVGMSTVHECICAAHDGMKILGISLVTNMAAGVLDKPLSEEEVLTEAQAAQGRFSSLLLDFLKKA
ncbi:MAG: purine-nucleoside phosphorylase [Treponema sp.]|jgi:purine-nucleoside phosphorylase|nr:purine-nucleoside phosphorylase [Treponema sp.]